MQKALDANVDVQARLERIKLAIGKVISVSRRAAGYMCRCAVYQLLVPSTAAAKQNFQ